MRSLTAAALFVLLTACGVQIDDNHGYGYAFDEAATDGLRVRYANSAPPRIDILDKAYVDTAACMSVQVLPTGPLMIFVDDLVAKVGHDALVHLDTGTILLDSLITTRDWSPTATYDPTGIIKHEIVHFLLKQTGMPDDQNSAHDSPFFTVCMPSAGVIVAL